MCGASRLPKLPHKIEDRAKRREYETLVDYIKISLALSW